MRVVMSICELCRVRGAVYICRRCGKRVCHQCLHSHGLCIRCAKELLRRK